MPLYGRLFRSRYKPEDFFTEAFADLFTRLAPADARDLVGSVLLGHVAEERSPEVVKDQMRKSKRLECSTQYPIELREVGKVRKVPDAALFADGELIALIENKLDAPFTARCQPGAGKKSNTQTFHQLEDYGRWLNEHHPKAALVLLTHETKSPPEFLTAKGDFLYKIPLRSVCRWPRVHNWFSNWAADRRGENVAGTLAGEFSEFIEAQNMGEIAFDDIGLLNDYICFASRKIGGKITDVLESARRTGQQLVPPNPSNWVNNSRLFFDRNWLAFWDWSYPYGKMDLFVGWGFAGGNGPMFRGLELPNGLHAFVMVQGDRALRSLRRRPTKLRSWTPVTEGESEWWLRTKSADDLARSKHGFSKAFLAWMEPLLKEAAQIAGEARRCL